MRGSLQINVERVKANKLKEHLKAERIRWRVWKTIFGVIFLVTLDVIYFFNIFPLVLGLPGFHPLAISRTCSTIRQFAYPVLSGAEPIGNWGSYLLDPFVPGKPVPDFLEHAGRSIVIKYYEDESRPYRRDGALKKFGARVPYKLARELRVMITKDGWFCKGGKGCGIPTEEEVKEQEEKKAKEKAEKEAKEKGAGKAYVGKAKEKGGEENKAKEKGDEGKAKPTVETVETKVETKTEGENKSGGQSDVVGGGNKPEGKPEGKSEGKPEGKPEGKAESKPEGMKSEGKVEGKPEGKAGADEKTDGKTVPTVTISTISASSPAIGKTSPSSSPSGKATAIEFGSLLDAELETIPIHDTELRQMTSSSSSSEDPSIHPSVHPSIPSMVSDFSRGTSFLDEEQVEANNARTNVDNTNTRVFNDNVDHVRRRLVGQGFGRRGTVDGDIIQSEDSVKEDGDVVELGVGEEGGEESDRVILSRAGVENNIGGGEEEQDGAVISSASGRGGLGQK